MEQINYQPESFSGIVPELQVPDYSSSFFESQRSQLTSMEQQLADIQRQGKVDQLNLEQKQSETNALMKLSKTFAEKGLEEYQEYKKSEYDRVFFEYYNRSQEEQEALIKSQEQQERELQAEDSADAAQLTAASRRDPENAGIYNSLQGLTGYRKIAALNALALARADQYPAFRADIIKKLNPQNPAEEKAAEVEAMSQWADQTKMNRANPGFLAKNVFPKLRRVNQQESERFRLQYAADEGQKERTILISEWVAKKLTTEELRKRMTATMDTDGKTFFSNTKFIDFLNNGAKDGSVPISRFIAMGEEKNTVTGKLWKDDPRFGGWMYDARNYLVKLDTLDKKEQAIEIEERFRGKDRDQATAERDKMIAENKYDADLIQQGYTNARKDDLDTIRVQKEVDEGNKYLTENPGKQIPYEIWRNWSYEARQRFKGQLEPDPTGATAYEDLAGSDEGKQLKKDVKAAIAAVDVSVPIANEAQGVTGAINQKAFELQTTRWILNRASQMILTAEGPLSKAKAIQDAKEEWIQNNKELIAKNGIKAFYDADTLSFVGDNSGFRPVNVGQSQAAGMIARSIQNATLNNLDKSLYDSDFEFRPNGDYSLRVKLLARKFSMTPEELVQRARITKGGFGDPESPAVAAQAQIPSSDRARIASVTNPSTQLYLRSQIRSGQTVSGTPEQRAVAVGRQIISLGYGGVWQNQFFNYETGYTASGGQEVMQRSYSSAHNEGMGKALDIGLAANSMERLDSLYEYLRINQRKFGIKKIIWRAPGHYDHIHIEF